MCVGRRNRRSSLCKLRWQPYPAPHSTNPHRACRVRDHALERRRCSWGKLAAVSECWKKLLSLSHSQVHVVDRKEAACVDPLQPIVAPAAAREWCRVPSRQHFRCAVADDCALRAVVFSVGLPAAPPGQQTGDTKKGKRRPVRMLRSNEIQREN